MVFTSWAFAAFLLVLLPAVWRLPHRARNRLLLAASLAFYAAWDWRFVGLLLTTIGVDFSVGRALEAATHARRRRALLGVSLATNLGILGFFKYWNFFVDSANAVLNQFGLGALAGGLELAAPVGVSFYTFQSLGYVIDVYRQQGPAVRRIEDYALFVAYFPQLLAGPIGRARDLVPQWQEPRPRPDGQRLSGAWLLLRGVFKKIVIADNLAVWVDATFAMPAWDNALVCVLALYAYAAQIYADFSGYTDMARGVSRLMGIELARNFDHPYIASDPADFWRRWHISLSTWLRDYLFLPISYAVSRRVDAPSVLGLRADHWIYGVSIVATMALGGLWHGAAWTFVAWGIYHGLLLAVFRVVNRRRRKADPWRALKTVGTFHAVTFGWLLFRARDLAQVRQFLASLASLPAGVSGAETMIVEVVLLVLVLAALEIWLRDSERPAERPGFAQLAWIVVPLMLAALVVLEPPAGKSFIYFQF